MNESLTRQLMAWVLLPVGAAVALQAEVSWSEADRTATVIQDRLLVGSARMIAEQLRYEDDEFEHSIPPAALELFQSREDDHVFYRLTTASGRLLAGSSELALPARSAPDANPNFSASTVRGQPVHVAAVQQPVIGNAAEQFVTIQVAQTLIGHDALRKALWERSVVEQILIFGLTALMISFGLRRGLGPVVRLRQALLARPAGSLDPFSGERVPAELVPLMAALNDYIHRLQLHTASQKTFIEDAAHQLRTPLTVLTTQIDLVSRSNDPLFYASSLAAVQKSLGQANRIVNQLLTLSSAQSQAEDRSNFRAVALDELAQQVLEDHAAQAYAKRIDLGLESASPGPRIVGHPTMLHEMVSNLVDNAIRYTPEGGVVTVGLVSTPDVIELIVEDDGPGIASEDIERVFERFVRLDERAASGSGLGLSIVRELARRNGGGVTLGPGAHGRGLRASISFRAEPSR